MKDSSDTMKRRTFTCDICLCGLFCLPIYTLANTCGQSSTLSLGNQTVTWEGATSLPIIESQGDQDCLEVFLNGTSGQYWIGIQLADPPDYWAWVDYLDTSDQDLYLRYQGCFYEFYDQRDLPNPSNLPESEITIDNCISWCTNNSFLFAGLHDGDQCYCGNSFGTYHATGGCPNLACSGDSSQKCGSSGKNAIYYNGGAWGNWVNEQPNNYNGIQFCGGMKKENGKVYIQDENCADELQYVCEIPDDGDSTCSTESAFGIGSNMNSKCYYLSSSAKEWYLAQQNCRKIGGQLLTVKTENVYNSTEAGLVSMLPTETIWVGLQRNRWKDSDGNWVKFTNFASGQQPKVASPENKFVAVEYGSYLWKTFNGTFQIPQIIETVLTTTTDSTSTKDMGTTRNQGTDSTVESSAGMATSSTNNALIITASTPDRQPTYSDNATSIKITENVVTTQKATSEKDGYTSPKDNLNQTTSIKPSPARSSMADGADETGGITLTSSTVATTARYTTDSMPGSTTDQEVSPATFDKNLTTSSPAGKELATIVDRNETETYGSTAYEDDSLANTVSTLNDAYNINDSNAMATKNFSNNFEAGIPADTQASTSDGLSATLIVVIVVLCVLVIAIIVIVVVCLLYGKNRRQEKGNTLDLRGEASKANGGTLDSRLNQSFTRSLYNSSSTTNLMGDSRQSNTPRSILSSKSSLGQNRPWSGRKLNRVGVDPH